MRRNSAKVLVKQGSVVCHHANEANETSILTRSTWALFWISINESNEDWRHNRQTKQNTFLKEIFIPLQLKVRSWYQRVPAAVFLEVRVWHARVWPPKKVRYPFRLGPFSVEFPRQTGRVVSVWWLKKMTLNDFEESNLEMKQNCKRTKSQSFYGTIFCKQVSA